MSQYVELMQLRKIALLQGDEKTAQELWDAAAELERAGLVTEKDHVAAACFVTDYAALCYQVTPCGVPVHSPACPNSRQNIQADDAQAQAGGTDANAELLNKIAPKRRTTRDEENTSASVEDLQRQISDLQNNQQKAKQSLAELGNSLWQDAGTVCIGMKSRN